LGKGKIHEVPNFLDKGKIHGLTNLMGRKTRQSLIGFFISLYQGYISSSAGQKITSAIPGELPSSRSRQTNQLVM
jgi:hypothetical protein